MLLTIQLALKEMITEIQSFYKRLFNKKEINGSNFNFFDYSINKVSDTDQTKCEGLITEAECISALKLMKNQKRPGSDGISVEFNKLF